MKKVVLLILCCASLLGSCTFGLENPEGKNKTAEPLATFELGYVNVKAYADGSGTKMTQTIFEIKNTGQDDLFLTMGSYDFKDASGNVIANKRNVIAFPQVIYPGESAYYYEEALVDFEAGTQAISSLVSKPSVEIAEVECIRFPVTVTELAEAETGGIKVTGNIENTSEKDYANIYVVAMLFNVDDEPIGIMYTYLTDNLASGTKVDFEIYSTTMLAEDILKEFEYYTVISYPLQSQF